MQNVMLFVKYNYDQNLITAVKIKNLLLQSTEEKKKHLLSSLVIKILKFVQVLIFFPPFPNFVVIILVFLLFNNDIHCCQLFQFAMTR